ncbi:hypothetical protein [Pseudomonas phage phipa2]|uniref:Holin n=1 Tax=Pseudomonas phage phipa2 TaxID=2894298 RepID=A0AAE9C9A1_9CAUD|nr:hypothetical protein [Pseudomonas phage phipa2]
MMLDTATEAGKGTLAITGVGIAVYSPYEIASLCAAVLTALYVGAQLITLLPKMLDSIAELRRRFKK